MKYSNIKRVLSAALLIAFTAPSGIAYSTYGSYGSYNSSTPVATSTELTGNVQLTQKNDKITLSLRDSDVRQVLRMFADKAGKNIVFHSSVEGKITLDLVDMPINEAFALVLNIAGLNYYDQNNTLVILSKNSEDNANFSKQEMMTFPVQYVSASKIADFLNNNVFGMKKTGMSGGDAATVNAATNEVIVFGMPSDAAIVRKVIAQLDKEPSQRTFTVSHTTPAEMADMICNFLLPAHGAGGKGSGGGSDKGYASTVGGMGTGGAAGIVTGGAASSEEGTIKLGEGVVACTVSQSASGGSNAPFDLQNIAISYYPQRGTILMMGGSEAQLNMVENFIKTNDIKQPQAFLELSIVELNEQGSKEFQNNWQFNAGSQWGVSFNNGVTSGGRYTPGHGMANWLPVTKYVKRYIEDSRGNMTKEYYYEPRDSYYPTTERYPGTYIQWTMNYLIENKKARVLANPKILITNGQESVIDLTEDYVEKVTSEFLSSASSGASTQGTVQKTYTIGEDKGIKITLTPFISPDGYVTMNIKPEYATEAGKVYSTSVTGESEIGATLLNRRNLDLKNVRIKDGETLVIGGMITEIEQKNVQKVPILGDIPVVGAAFRSTVSSKSKAELIIMITPKILVDGESVADNL